MCCGWRGPTSSGAASSALLQVRESHGLGLRNVLYRGSNEVLQAGTQLAEHVPCHRGFIHAALPQVVEVLQDPFPAGEVFLAEDQHHAAGGGALWGRLERFVHFTRPGEAPKPAEAGLEVAPNQFSGARLAGAQAPLFYNILP